MNGNFSNAQPNQRFQPAAVKELFQHVLFEKQAANSASRFVVSVICFEDNNKTPYISVGRQFYKPEIDSWLPTKRSVCLPVEAWRALTATDGLNEQIEQVLNDGFNTDGLAGGLRGVSAGVRGTSGRVYAGAATAGMCDANGDSVTVRTGSGASDQQYSATSSKTPPAKYSGDVTYTANDAVDGSYQPKRRKHDQH
jgi:hypothetical protein